MSNKEKLFGSHKLCLTSNLTKVTSKLKVFTPGVCVTFYTMCE